MNFRIGLPHSFGWLRYPDADKGHFDAWEMPSGRIRYVRHGRPFCVVQDADGTRIKHMMTKAHR